MFAGPDPFPQVVELMSQSQDSHETRPTVRPVAGTSNRSKSPFTSQVAGSSKTASKRKLSSPSHASLTQKFKISRPGDGWYVAHNAVLPGVYYGTRVPSLSSYVQNYPNTHSRDALRNAKPMPGGFHCALNKESADLLFHDITINGAIVWADIDGGQ
jgi:hypothetical protein